jgi:hypothetical protein
MTAHQILSRLKTRVLTLGADTLVELFSRQETRLESRFLEPKGLAQDTEEMSGNVRDALLMCVLGDSRDI